MKQEGPEAPKGSQTLEKWSMTGSARPAVLRAGAMGKGREGDKSPSQGLGGKGFMNLRTGPLHALRLSASADYPSTDDDNLTNYICDNYNHNC